MLRQLFVGADPGFPTRRRFHPRRVGPSAGLAALIPWPPRRGPAARPTGRHRQTGRHLPTPTRPDPPWAPEIAHLRDPGIPALSVEGEVVHIHQHFGIWVLGHPVDVPGGT